VKLEKAIDLVNRLNELGYSCNMLAAVTPQYIHPDTGTDRNYSVSLAELGVDKVDVKALIEVADEFDLDLGYSPIQGRQSFSFDTPHPAKPEVVVGLRRHPRRKNK
jgi:hypothetical protein